MRREALAGAVAAATAAVVVAAAAAEGGPAPRGPGGWGALEPSPLERTEVAAARIDDVIYVVGGFVEAGGDTGKMAAYDIGADEWTELKPHPLAVNHAGVATADGYLYVYGGQRGPAGGPMSARLERYDPALDEWTRLEDAPSARMGMAFVTAGDRLYAIGGRNASNERLRRVEIYDVSAERWRGGPGLKVGRNHVAGAVSGETIFAIGGRPGPIHGGLRTVESWRIGSKRWKPERRLGTARSGAVAVTVTGGDIVVFGGEELGGGETIEQVERLDVDAGEWSDLPDMTTPRHGLGGAASESRVYAIEGGPHPGLAYSNANEYLDVP